MKDFTLEVYRIDRRCKSGERLVGKYDYHYVEELWMDQEVADLQFKLYPRDKFRLAVFETMVERKNLMTGETYRERYDTPHSCSPSTETYWSM